MSTVWPVTFTVDEPSGLYVVVCVTDPLVFTQNVAWVFRLVKRKVAPFPAAIDRTKAFLSLNSQTCGRFQPNQSTCPSTVRSCVSGRAPPRLTIFGSLTRALTSTVPFGARCECARARFGLAP